MKSLILTVAYLWKDTWNRWFEQPGSPLARGVVVGILASLSAFLLVGFYLQERTILSKIQALGADTIILKNNTTQLAHSHGGTINQLERLFPNLDNYGNSLHINMLPAIAKDGQKGIIPVITSQSLELKYGQSFILFSKTKLPGTSIRLSLNENFLNARVIQPPQWIQGSGFNELLLIPIKWMNYFGDVGTSEWLIFNDDAEKEPTLETIVASIERMKRSESLNTLQIISPVQLRKELDEWRNKAKLWKQALLLSLALVISLICGTISILEFRQNLYIYSLMKSFGISNKLLYLRAFSDSFFVANSFSILVILIVYSSADWIFGNFGFSSSLIYQSLTAQSLWLETAQLFLGVNAGVILGSFPIYIALKKPIGLVLN